MKVFPHLNPNFGFAFFDSKLGLKKPIDGCFGVHALKLSVVFYDWLRRWNRLTLTLLLFTALDDLSADLEHHLCPRFGDTIRPGVQRFTGLVQRGPGAVECKVEHVG